MDNIQFCETPQISFKHLSQKYNLYKFKRSS